MLIETSTYIETIDSPPPSSQHDALVLRQPTLNDAAAIHDLVAHCPPLDLNSLYAYLLLTHHHASSCIVATNPAQHVRGFISAYIPPQTPDVLFVWQVAVHERARGAGLGQQMLTSLLSRPALQSVRYIETTVSADNSASRRMFASLARQYATKLSESSLFDPQHFGTHAHDAEHLLRIGPF